MTASSLPATADRAARGSLRRLFRLGGYLLAGAAAAVVVLAAFSAIMRVQERSLPTVTGTSAVGRTEIALTDSSRHDPFAADTRDRELAVWIWYPAVAGSSGPAAPYLPAAWAPLASTEWVLSQDFNAVRTNSIADARLDGRPPVVVLMPGLGQPVANYSALAEDLASHGYAVIGINPTGSSDVVFPDGHHVGPTELGGVAEMDVPSWYASAERVTTVWVQDIEFVVETLAASPPVIGALDFDRVAYVGHSLGGAASFEACHQDVQCAAAVNLDGTLWTDVRRTGLEAPSLLLRHAPTGECDAFCAAAAADFAAVDAVGDSRQFVVDGAKHMDFGDLGLMWGPANGLLVLGDIDASRMSQLTRDLVLSFVDEHVREAATAPFEAVVARYEEVR